MGNIAIYSGLAVSEKCVKIHKQLNLHNFVKLARPLQSF